MADSKTSKYKFLNEQSSIVVSDVTHADRLLKFLYECYQKERYWDVIVQVDQRHFKTHRFVLAMISDYFRALFQHDGVDQETIKFSLVNSKIFDSILKFGYTAKIDLETEDVEELVKGADILVVSSLKDICELQLMRTISKETCFRLLVLADKYTLPNLFKDVQCYWCNNFKPFIDAKEFLDLPPYVFLKVLADDRLKLRKCVSEKQLLSSYEREKLLYKCTLKFINANLSTKDFDDLLKLLKAIKLFELTKADVDQKLKKYKKLKENQQVQDLIDLAELYRSSKILVDKDQLPSYWLTSRIPAISRIIKSASFGSGHYMEVCRNFDSEEVDRHTRITQMILWTRSWDGRNVLGRIQIIYEDGSVVDSGTRPNHSEITSTNEYQVNLYAGEVITQVKLFSGWLIDNLEFTTDKGRRFGPYGGDGGGVCVAKAPVSDSYLQGVHGNVTISQGEVAVMRLVWEWIKFD